MNIVTISNLQLDTASRTLSNHNGQSIELRPLTFNVFSLLIENHGTPVKREKIYAECWSGRVVTDQALTNVISELRRVLISLKATSVEIKTVSKIGYYLSLPSANSPIVYEPASYPVNTEVLEVPSVTKKKLPQMSLLEIFKFAYTFKLALFITVSTALFLTGFGIFHSPPKPNFINKDNYSKFEMSHLSLYFSNVSGKNFDINKVIESLETRNFENIKQCKISVYVRVYRSLYDESRLASKIFVFTQDPTNSKTYHHLNATTHSLAETLNRVAINRKTQCNSLL
ncbi:winged helix-turn-helix domain-containing protein [Vibrio sp. Isolate23]|uniref:winged helix-turn-helix domain-containing protein n=1 Tax=Vibrio sp. Isolate23 TaxID=2908533 RepID=UPI0023D930EF|nr:winged helix-turn-helix domain-containing protein [Vibrio sp. Isolate23]